MRTWADVIQTAALVFLLMNGFGRCMLAEDSIVAHIEIRKQLYTKIDEAERLRETGEYCRAAREFLHVFEGSRSHDEMTGLRLGPILAEIASLAKKCAEARRELEALRDQREALILNGGSEYMLLLELVAINESLDEGLRTREFLATMNATKQVSQETVGRLRGLVYSLGVADVEDVDAERLDAEGERALWPRIGFTIEKLIRLEIEEDFPHYGDAPVATERRRGLRQATINDCAALYGLLLKSESYETAEKVRKWVLRIRPDEFAFSALIEAAVEAGNTSMVWSLREEASKCISGEKMRTLPGK